MIDLWRKHDKQRRASDGQASAYPAMELVRLNEIREREKFLEACTVGDEKEVERLFTPQRAAQKDQEGAQPIHWACGHGHLGVVKLLNERGTALNVGTADGSQPMHWACLNGELEVVTWLHGQGIHVGVMDSKSSQPLHYACISGKLEVAQWLLQNGADLEASDDKGYRPAHWACASGNVDLIMLLRKAGCATNVVAVDQHTPISLAKEIHGNSVVVSWLLNGLSF